MIDEALMSSTASVPTGYVLAETDDVVVIATLHSENVKTGDMVQIWILCRNESPVEAVRNGTDDKVCFDCGMRGIGFKKRKCYVNVAQGPNSVHHAYRDGKYPFLPIDQYALVFGGRKVRFGAYGEPILIPLEIMEAITKCAVGWTGYTHQWKRAEYQAYRAFLMASCDSFGESVRATEMGWRYFRVRSTNESLAAGEITCPASAEAGHRTTCENCLLCNGKRANETRKNISILVHGSGAKNFIQIGA